MDPWQHLSAEYDGKLADRQRRDQEQTLRETLQREYLAWAERAAQQVLTELVETLKQRLALFAERTGARFAVSDVGRVQLGNGRVAAFSVSIWDCCVHVYTQRADNSPPTVHLLRQSGGHRSPKMSCLPGAWLARTSEGNCELRRFDAASSLTTVDELGAQVVSLLLEAATRT